MENHQHIKALVLDIDGVVWRDFRAIPDVQEVVEYAYASGVEVCFLTNNSSESRSLLCDRLADIGIPVDPGRLYTAASITSAYIAARSPIDHCYVTVGGGAVLLSELRAVNLAAQPLADFVRADRDSAQKCTVVTGHHPGFGYIDITRLLGIAGQATDLFATDRDLWYSTLSGPRPSSGWVVAAVEEVLRLRATTIGKPNAVALEMIAGSLSIETGSILMVGDCLSVDVGAAHNAGAISCHFDDPAVRADYRILDSGPIPDHVVHSQRELKDLLGRLNGGGRE